MTFGVERMAAGSAVAQMPSRSLLHGRRGRGFLHALARRAAVTIPVASVLTSIAITVTVTKASALAVTKSEPPLVALAITVRLAHHCGGAFFMLLHANREIAQHILAEPLLALDFIEGSRRRIDVEEGEMRLAILPQPIREGFCAPLLGLCDLASHLLDYPFELSRELLDLLRAGVLPRQEDVFIERHGNAFPWSSCSPSAKPFEPVFSGKARKLGRREQGTPNQLVLQPDAPPGHRPFSSRPGSSGSAPYRDFR